MATHRLPELSAKQSCEIDIREARACLPTTASTSTRISLQWPNSMLRRRRLCRCLVHCDRAGDVADRVVGGGGSRATSRGRASYGTGFGVGCGANGPGSEHSAAVTVHKAGISGHDGGNACPVGDSWARGSDGQGRFPDGDRSWDVADGVVGGCGSGAVGRGRGTCGAGRSVRGGACRLRCEHGAGVSVLESGVARRDSGCGNPVGHRGAGGGDAQGHSVDRQRYGLRGRGVVNGVNRIKGHGEGLETRCQHRSRGWRVDEAACRV